MSAPDSDLSSSMGHGDDVLPSRRQAAWRWTALGLTLAALGLLIWHCVFDPKIRFLVPGPGKWIVYPLPPEGRPYPAFELAGIFRRTFVLPEKPAAAAMISWRCLTNGELHVNGTVVSAFGLSPRNWKATEQSDISQFLHQGTNEISVMVLNQTGPPALSLELNAGNFSLASDESWEVSVSGSDWCAAQAASATPKAGKGNELSLLETTNGALKKCWPLLCLFAAISSGGLALWRYCLARIRPCDPSSFPKMTLVVLAAIWLLLFLHNFPFMPAASGFDGAQHLAYVNYIQENHRLPQAREGWEMFQPPLYYFISAGLLSLASSGALEPSGMMLLRFLSLAIGTVNLALVFAGLRLIFPDDWKKPLAGLVLAAFLPAQICLLHYTTNETLSAMFVTGALCLGLHLLRARRPWWGWNGILGCVLGLALLSKASAMLAVPVIMGALAMKLVLRRERTLRVWLKTIGVPLVICLSIGGWHYFKLWHEYGDAFTGNWDSRVFAPWWQAKGFQTPGYYFSFGESLTRPFFSGFHSFWDSFYTTLWGDGLLGGKIDVWGRPPWNCDLMAVGFILALIPTALVLTGLACVCARCYRAVSLSWLLLLGLGWLFAFAIVDMSLKVPSYEQTKAFFGLPALLPFCALGGLGYEFWSGRGKNVQSVLRVALGIWLFTVYASFWIKPNSAQTGLSSAIAASVYVKGDSSKAFVKLLERYPGNSEAIIWLASLEAREHPEQGVKRLEQALKDDPANASIEASLAWDMARCGRLDEAIVHAKLAVELAPEDEIVARGRCTLELRHKNFEESIAAGRHALSLNPTDLETHFNLGVALMNLRQIPEAISHLSSVVRASPAWAEANFDLGLCLLDQTGKRDEALDHLHEAVRLNPTNTAWRAALQKALR